MERQLLSLFLLNEVVDIILMWKCVFGAIANANVCDCMMNGMS